MPLCAVQVNQVNKFTIIDIDILLTSLWALLLFVLVGSRWKREGEEESEREREEWFELQLFPNNFMTKRESRRVLAAIKSASIGYLLPGRFVRGQVRIGGRKKWASVIQVVHHRVERLLPISNNERQLTNNHNLTLLHCAPTQSIWKWKLEITLLKRKWTHSIVVSTCAHLADKWMELLDILKNSHLRDNIFKVNLANVNKTNCLVSIRLWLSSRALRMEHFPSLAPKDLLYLPPSTLSARRRVSPP